MLFRSGLLATVYGRLRDPGLTAEDCTTVLLAAYRHAPCVRVLPVDVYGSEANASTFNVARGIVEFFSAFLVVLLFSLILLALRVDLVPQDWTEVATAIIAAVYLPYGATLRDGRLGSVYGASPLSAFGQLRLYF